MKQIDLGKFIVIEILKWVGFLLLYLITKPFELIETKYLLITFVVITISSLLPLFIMTKRGGGHIHHQSPFFKDSLELSGVLNRRSYKKLFLYLNEKVFFPVFLVIFLFFSLFKELKDINWAHSAYKYYFQTGSKILLALLISSGIILALSDSQITKKSEAKFGRNEIIFTFALAGFAFYIILIKTLELGWVSIVISVLSSALICLVSFLIFNENNSEEKIS